MSDLCNQIRRTAIGAIGALFVSSMCLASAMGPARAIETAAVAQQA